MCSPCPLQARLLGFQTYAEVSMARKMAGDVGAVDELTAMLLAKALPAAEMPVSQVMGSTAMAGGGPAMQATARRAQGTRPGLGIWEQKSQRPPMVSMLNPIWVLCIKNYEQGLWPFGDP